MGGSRMNLVGWRASAFTAMRYGWYAARAGVLAACAVVALVGAASQASAAPAIVAAAEIWAAPSGETPLNLSIESGEAIPAQVVMIVRGLPASLKLTEGKLFGPGVWVVPLNAINKIKLNAPADAAGRADLSLALVSLEGTSLTEKKLTLFLAPPSKAPEPQAAAAPTPPAPPAEVATVGAISPATVQPRVLSKADKAMALRLKKMGDKGLAGGDILSARPLYQAAAERGLPEAAIALAATYDPAELSRMKGIVGVTPDPAQAKKWYVTAQELGAPEADARLQALGN